MADALMNTAAAIAWLSERGVDVSAKTLQRMRSNGQIRFVKGRGRNRVLFTAKALADAFFQERILECLSGSENTGTHHTGRCAAPSQGDELRRARERLTAPRRKKSAPDGRRNSGTVLAMVPR